MKNTLGNFTIMDPAQNTLSGNQMFDKKNATYSSSSMDITKEIGKKIKWEKHEIEENKEKFINAAISIFIP